LQPSLFASSIPSFTIFTAYSSKRSKNICAGQIMRLLRRGDPRVCSPSLPPVTADEPREDNAHAPAQPAVAQRSTFSPLTRIGRVDTKHDFCLIAFKPPPSAVLAAPHTFIVEVMLGRSGTNDQYRCLLHGSRRTRI
jgi:hypothetical protein